MVGRPGRSRGCLTCRRRKVKCDETKPACQRCIKSAFECEGYKSQNFIVYVDGKEDKGGKSKLQYSSGSDASSPSDLISHDGEIAFNRTSPIELRRNSTPKLLSRTPSLLPLDDGLLLSYTYSIFATYRGVPGRGQKRIPWLGFYALEDGKRQAKVCLLAFASALFGKHQRLKQATDQGVRLYSESLRSLNRRLQSGTIPPARPSKTKVVDGDQLDDDSLLSAMILGTYELLNAASMVGWTSHFLGLGNMMRLRGPCSHVDEMPRRLLEGSRFIILLASTTERKSSFLAEEAWRTVPWTIHPKDAMHRLLDNFAHIPGLLAALDALQANGPDGRSDLCSRAMDVLDGLLDWRAAWDSLPGETSTETPNESSDQGSQALFPHVLTYPSLEAANCISIYDGACIMLYEILEEVAQGTMHSDNDFPDAMGGAGLYAQDKRLAAIEICRSVQFQLGSQYGLTGPLFVLWPVRVAFRALNGLASAEGRWLAQVLAGLKTGNNWSVSHATQGSEGQAAH